ncbi:MAG TPA: RNA pseudouridine synthase [Campylobacterales bacterium]|nr:RNA pseudouridine synthase [Campylobacterales bacterium]
MLEKAYKLVAIQESITNRSAKDLIDRGLVYSAGKKVVMARAEMHVNSKFRIEKILKIKKIYEDKKIIAVNKPAFITSEQISKKFKAPLLHRLDQNTSGVILLVKDEDFQKVAIEAFREREVLKVYHAWVRGIIAEDLTIDTPLLTMKNGGVAFTKPSPQGQEAISLVKPLEVEGKLSLLEVKIETGRTHQIRAHLKSIGHTIIGDVKYGGKPAKRLMLHAKKIALLGYEFEAAVPKDFKVY